MRLRDLVGEEKILRPTGGCRNCPRKLVDFVPPTLNDTAIMVVGEAPGAEEAAQGRGFVGKSGQFQKAELNKRGIVDFSVTNTIHCRPPNNRDPSKKEIECCLSQYVLDEVRGYPYVILVGRIPTAAFFPKAKYKALRGNVIHHPDFPGQRFYVTYHPAYALRNPEGKAEYLKQLDRFVRVMQEGAEVSWELIEGAGDRVMLALDKILAKPTICLDVETDRLESWDIAGKIPAFSVAADEKTVVSLHQDDPFYIAAAQRVAEYMQNPEHGILGHNTGFDIDWFETTEGFKSTIRRIFDTQILTYQLRGVPMASLKEEVSRHLDGYRYLVYLPHKCKDPELLKMYNAEDVINTVRLHNQLVPLLKPSTRDLYITVAGPSGLQSRRMQHNGIYYHRDYAQDLADRLVKRRKESVQAWKADDPQFRPGDHESGKGLTTYLEDLHGFTSIKETKTGRSSWDADALKELVRNGAPYIQHLLDIRTIDKQLSTFVMPYLEEHTRFDGRVHSSYHDTTTDTGRRSSSSPNMQNIPREKEIRDCWGAPADRAFTEGDYSQIELRIGFSLADDDFAISNYLAGFDQHRLTAQILLGIENPTPLQRTQAKSVNFGLLYGGNWETLQDYAMNTYGIFMSKSQCQDFVHDFFVQFSSLKDWHKACNQDLRDNRGWTESACGHIHHYADWDSKNEKARTHAERASINMRCQGPAAYLMTYLQILTEREFLVRVVSAMQVNNGHDAMYIDHMPKDLDLIIQIAEQQNVRVADWANDWLKVPLVLDYKTGTHWGSLTGVEHTVQ